MTDLPNVKPESRAETVLAAPDKMAKIRDLFGIDSDMRRHAQLHALTKGIGDQRHVLQVWQKRPLGLVIGVGNVVSHLPALAGQLAYARHDVLPDS